MEGVLHTNPDFEPAFVRCIGFPIPSEPADLAFSFEKELFKVLGTKPLRPHAPNRKERRLEERKKKSGNG